MKQEVLLPKYIEIIEFKPLKQLSIPEYVAGFKSLGLACMLLAPGEKFPLESWKDLTPENCDYDRIAENYGVKLSRHINVLDIDPRNGGLESFYELVDDIGGCLEVGMTVKTQGGGYHLYFLNPDGVKLKNKPPRYPGIDVQGEGQIVVGPGSVLNGRPYLYGEVQPCLSL